MRPHRISAPEFFFHVTARGNNRQDIFQTDIDKLDYLRRMSEAFSSFMIRLLAYCLMTNHLHLLVQDVRGGALPSAMQRLQGGYAQAWNRRYKRSGHVYGERYHAEPVSSESHLVAGSCYIHDNPREAGLVKHARSYRWSSVRAYLGGKTDVPVSTDLILDLCGGPKKYAILLKETENIPSSEEHLPGATKVRELWTAGLKEFLDDVEPRVERRADRRKPARRPAGLTLEGLWDEVNRRTGITRKEICSPSRVRQISEARALLCTLARREGISATDVAQTLHRTTSAVIHLAESRSKKPIHRI